MKEKGKEQHIPQHVRDVLTDVLLTVEKKHCSSDKHAILKHWDIIIPAGCAGYAYPQSIHKKTLFITVVSSAHMHTLMMRKQEILKNLQTVINSQAITDICLKIGTPHKGEQLHDE